MRFFVKIKQMIFKKEKTNWQYIAIAVILAVLAGGAILFLRHIWMSGDLASPEPAAVHRPEPQPGINRYFINQVDVCFIPAAAAYGYALRVTSGYRSMEDQEQLFEQGRNESGRIVTWAPVGKSMHNYGYAVDVVDRRKGYGINWKRLAKIGEFCGLEQVDDSHFEYRGGLTTEQFMAGERPSRLSLSCAIMAERAKMNQPLTLRDLKDCGAPEF